MLNELDFTNHSLNDFWFGLKGMLFEEATERSPRLLKELLEGTLEGELREYVQVNRYERSESRSGYRNGYPTRNLMTTWGLIEDIRVPGDRSSQLQPKAFERYKRVDRRVDDGVLKTF